MIGSESAAKEWLSTLPECDEAAMERLELLVRLLAEENSRQNLVSAASLDAVWQRHIVDSAQLLPHVPRETCSPWMDLGSGAGFPGLVVAAMRPECRIVLVESRTRRADWLSRACEQLELSLVDVAAMRLERMESRPVSVISARAFAPLEKLLDLSARFSTESTRWLLPKGRSAREELSALGGWNHLFHVEQSLTDSESGVIVGTLSGRKGRKL
jgi:16S rRNA (guanine527-N7)-methyltransferase